MSDFQAAIKEDTTYGLAYFNAANLYFFMRRFKQVYTFHYYVNSILCINIPFEYGIAMLLLN